MAIKNIMEDIVGNLINEVIKKEGESFVKGANRDDIMAYVLNRIPSKYVTSERGILYGTIRRVPMIQENADVLFLIYEALDIIKSGRLSHVDNEPDVVDEMSMPHIIGEVLNIDGLTPIVDVNVSLSKDGELVSMVDSSWRNPYLVSGISDGHFHFWPLYAGDDSVNMTLIFEHQDYEKQEIPLDISVVKGGGIGASMVVPVVLLKKK